MASESHITERTDGGDTLVFEFPEDAGGDTTVEVVECFENRYGDLRAVLDTPAPWDTPDDMTGVNELVKSLPWDEDEAEGFDGLDSGSFYTFEDRAGNGGHEDVWVVDAVALGPLKKLTDGAGYGWEGPEDLDDAGRFMKCGSPDVTGNTLAQERLRVLGHEANEGDWLKVVYEKKSGNGLGEKEGEVTAANGDDSGGLTVGVSIRREDGHFNKVKEDDGGEPAVLSSGRYPYMGRLVRAELEGDL